MSYVRPFVAAGLIGLAATTLFAPLAGAQQVYRIVGPDGKVTFSDKAPLDSNVKLAPVVAYGVGTGSSTASLPFELRQAADKFPVTLYTNAGCGPCGSGRAYLTSRGIPFSERTIVSAADAEALKRIAGVESLPLLTVGGQQIKGYSDAEWGQFLDAAGYPAKSTLPPSWRNREPTPLVTVQAPAAPASGAGSENAAGTARRPNPPQPRPEPSNENNPAGIKF